MNSRSRACFLSLAVIALLASGCGGAMIIVKGKVTRGGQPLPLKAKEKIVLTFHTEDTPAGRFPDYFKGFGGGDGNFEVFGNEGKGIPAGKYRIAVEVNRGDSDKDRLGGAFSKTESKIVRTVDGKNINIDLDRPEG